LHFVDELALYIALIVVEFDIWVLGLQLGKELLEGVAAVDAGLACAEQVQVGTVDNLYFHYRVSIRG